MKTILIFPFLGFLFVLAACSENDRSILLRLTPQGRNILFNERISLAKDQCNDMNYTTEIAKTNCLTPKILEAFRFINYPYMDLVNMTRANKLLLAEKYDNHSITLNEYDARKTELESEFNNQVAMRNGIYFPQRIIIQSPSHLSCATIGISTECN